MSNRSYYEKKRITLPTQIIPTAPEWPKLIGQLVRAGVSKVEIAEHIGVVRRWSVWDLFQGQRTEVFNWR